MLSCQLKDPLILQLQSIYKSITIYNQSNNSFSSNTINLTILPTDQPIGFSLDYLNINEISANRPGLLDPKKTAMTGTSEYIYPNISRSITTIPEKVKLSATITINNQSINPVHMPIVLETSVNGKTSQSKAYGLYGKLKILLTLTYTYIKLNNRYKWTILNGTLTLINIKI